MDVFSHELYVPIVDDISRGLGLLDDPFAGVLDHSFFGSSTGIFDNSLLAGIPNEAKDGPNAPEHEQRQPIFDNNKTPWSLDSAPPVNSVGLV
jgi:hypothetical protein